MAKIVTTTINEINVDTPNNKSDLVFTLFINPNNTSTYCTNRPLTITCNGVTQSGSLTVPKGGSATLTFTFANIYHESDGSKSVNWSWNCPTSTSGLGNLEYSGTYTMQTIPRASSFSNVNINYIDDTMYFSIDKKTSNFTSSIRLLFTGNTSNPSDRFPVDVCSKDGRTYIPFNMDTNSNQYKGILQYNSNKTEIPLEVELTTYNGNAQIGNSVSVNATAKIKKIVPTVNATIIDTNPTTVEFTGDNTKIIRYLSKPKVTINAIPYQEASIKSYSIIADGGIYYTQEKQFDSGITSPQITVNAMDTRNWDNPTLYDLSTNGKWINYEKVILNCEYCERIEQTSSTIKCKLNGSFFNNTINGTANTLALSYRYRKQGENWQDNWITIPSADITINGNSFTYETSSLRTDCDDLNSWEFQFKANDVLMTTPIITKQITLGLGIVEIGKEFVNINGDLFVKDYPVVCTDENGTAIVGDLICKNLYNPAKSYTVNGNVYFECDIDNTKTYIFQSPYDWTLIYGIDEQGNETRVVYEESKGQASRIVTFVPTPNEVKIRCGFYTTASLDFNGVQLEIGDKVTDYVPFKEYGYDKNIITAGYEPNNGTITSTGKWGIYHIPLTVEVNKVGDKLSIVNGNIRIGKNISKVLINANLLITDLTPGEIGIQLDYVTGGTICATYLTKTSSLYCPLTISNFLVDVKEGYEIKLSLYMTNENETHQIDGSNGRRTWVTVEAVE